MDSSIVRQGLLAFRPKGLFTKYKEHYAVLVGASRSGLARLELYEVCKSTRPSNTVLVLVGKDIIKVIQEESVAQNAGRGFTVTTREIHHYFLARDARDCSKWVKTIQETLLKTNQIPVQRGLPSHVMEDNDIYISAEEVRRDFSVRLTGETQVRLGVKSPVRMLVASGTITIVSMLDETIALWAVKNIRKFGYTNDDLHIEIGRKCAFGPGVFTFITPQGRGISRLIHQEKECYKNQVIKERTMHSGILVLPSQNQATSLPILPEYVPTLTRAPASTSVQQSKQVILEGHIYEDCNNEFPELYFNTNDIQVQDRPDSKTSSIHSFSSESPGLETQIMLLEQQQTQNCRRSSGSLNSLSSTKSNESLPSDKVEVRNFSRMMSVLEISSDLSPIHSEGVIYSEPKDFQNAWKVHGYTSDDHAEGKDMSDKSCDVPKLSCPSKNKETRQEATAIKCEEYGTPQQLYALINPKKKCTLQKELEN